jgi:nicotinate-nucleotide adenylyltransferase
MNVGIVGGTFDPPHLAHVIPVEIASAEFHLDLVWYIPAFIPPHKQGLSRTDPYHRMAMLAIALQAYPKFKIATVELDRGDISFTIDTIQYFKKHKNAVDRLFFIMGSDSFFEVHTWYRPAELLGSCEWIIINRGALKSELRKNLEQLEINLQLDLKKTIHFASSPHLPYSSTAIRNKLERGESVSPMLNGEVEKYIHKHSLYRR